MPSVPRSHPLGPGLYVVATPLGHLEDLSPRARKVLRHATLVAAEDTRTSALLVRLAEGAGRMLSLTDHNVGERLEMVLTEARTEVVALVSDAGTPAISDPGTPLVEAAHAAGVRVVPIPGPSALAAALAVSGFASAPSTFLGFLPKLRGERVELLRGVAPLPSTVVFFENPGRLSRTLAELGTLFGDPPVVVCREMTKVHEEVVRGTASELAVRFADTRGECTVVVRIPAAEAERKEQDIDAYLAEMQRAGARRSAAAAEAARRFGVTREYAYGRWETAGEGR